jgi:hypothetical protein
VQVTQRLLEFRRSKTNGLRFYPGPAREELILIGRATGFQIYVCRPDADGKPAWTLKAPEAELFDEQGRSIGRHFGGPTWQLNPLRAGIAKDQARELLRCRKGQFDTNFV